MPDLKDIWTQALGIIQKELSGPSFEIWIKDTEAIAFKQNTFIIGVPNEFAKDWLESRYYDLISDTLKAILDDSINIKLVITSHNDIDLLEPEKTRENEIVEPKSFTKDKSEIGEDTGNTFLNPKYNFETFVVGNSNRFAHAASLAVAEAPAKAYNPLFIYGGVGLGKTHLMHAIGQYILDQNPRARVLYISSEKFTNELINSIRDDKTEQFRNKYRNIDILLIDDIQFLAGKERTQEEFFHTFNALHEADKQIIISSDRPPKDIPTLEDRLRSRFEWGLITDIQPPDLETRIAILRKKAKLEKLEVPNDVMHFIANKIPSNIRELEGALIRVMAFSSLTNRPITPELALDALKDIIPNSRPKQINIQLIQEIVSKYYGLNVDELKAKKRTRSVAYPRQIAMFLARELTDLSLPKIGEEFGGRDHTTVIHAHDKIASDIKKDKEVKIIIESLKEDIQK